MKKENYFDRKNVKNLGNYYNSCILKISKVIQRTALVFGISYFSCFVIDQSLGMRNNYYFNQSPKYKDINEFREDFEEEKRKIGIKRDLESRIKDGGKKAFALWSLENDEYYIQVRKDCMNRLVIRHELYHMKRWIDMENEGILDKTKFSLGDIWIEEWNATSYAIRNDEHKKE